tara:strand:+ start:462 stop:758 length:297 start_codon:yes stop_codon:yes gene_type:complete
MSEKPYKPGFFERLIINLVMNKLGLKKLLSGRKTYIVGLLMILNGIYSLIMGESPSYGNPDPVSVSDAWEMIGIGSGFATGRAGIQKLQDSVEGANNG